VNLHKKYFLFLIKTIIHFHKRSRNMGKQGRIQISITGI